MNPSTALRTRHWRVINKGKEDLIRTLLENRGIKERNEIEEFLNPKLKNVTAKNVGISSKQLTKTIKRIKAAIKNKEQVIVYGDYDVDGICGTAILWETLNNLGAKVLPYIPHRVEEGYGLSEIGISNIKSQIENPKLIITVDNGIVASSAVDFANKNNIDVIITDHHVAGKKLPKAQTIIHTTKLCGAGVAWVLAQELTTNKKQLTSHLELVTLATIADLVPLVGANRTLTKYGLEKLRDTKRIGLLALFRQTGIVARDVDTYEIGHIIAPRLNAMGRVGHAMDSLRLLCTRDKERAESFAQKLGNTNRERQIITEQTILHAKSLVNSKSKIKKLLFISHESYEQGIIGLVAGRLVEEFYRPAIVVAKGKKYSKASARSISGVNIIEFIRTAQSLLVDAGGHPMAAGFTIETEKLALLEKNLTDRAELEIDEESLVRNLRIDCELEIDDINVTLHRDISKLKPFGMGNPEPTFLTQNVSIADLRLVGQDGRHLKLKLGNFDAIAFGMGERSRELKIGDMIDVVYTIENNVWNGSERLQLKIKDLRLSKERN